MSMTQKYDAVQLPNGDMWRPNYKGKQEAAKSDTVEISDLQKQERSFRGKMKLAVEAARQEDGTYLCPWDGTTHNSSQEYRKHIETYFGDRLKAEEDQRLDALKASGRRAGTVK